MSANIGFVLPSLENVSPIKAAVFLATKLEGFEITIFVLKDYTNSPNVELIEVPKGIKVISIGVKSWFLSYFYIKKLDHFISSNNIDICMSYLLPADFMLSLSKSKVKKISNIRDILETSFFPKSKEGSFSKNCIRLIQRGYLKKFDNIITMTSDMKSYYQDLLPSRQKIELIHNFLDEKYTLESSSLVVGINMSDFPAIPNVTIVGSLIPRKSLFEAIEITEFCFEQGVEFNLHIVGDGPLMDSLKTRRLEMKSGTENVFFHGKINNPLPFIKCCDVLWSNSKSEGLSRSILEAAYLGVPCIINRIPGVTELVDNSSGLHLFDNKVGFIESFHEVCLKNSTANLGEMYRESYCIKQYINKFSEI